MDTKKREAREHFKKTIEELGFANAGPDQMTNSDYWLCTVTAMRSYSDHENQRLKKDNERLRGFISRAMEPVPGKNVLYAFELRELFKEAGELLEETE